MAVDSSGNGLHGTYSGVGGMPAPSASVPAPLTTSLRSRSFLRAQSHAIALLLPATLRPANGVTLSLWYRAMDAAPAGSELVTGGDTYLLRLHEQQLVLLKRYGAGAYAACESNRMATAGALDGKWHHVAGVVSAAGMTVFFDGQQVCASAEVPHRADLSYLPAAELRVGQNVGRSALYDFEGNIDDVRVYTRALSAGEIGSLFRGAP